MSPSASVTETPSVPAVKELGFSAKQGANWSEYLSFRPPYPQSFFDRIYSYHGAKPFATWDAAHDIGAGCGVVSATLANRFNNVVVSDPNPGYVALAQKLLVEDSGLPADNLQFLQEGAEKSSVAPGTIDVATVCECIHWTDTEATIREVHRELRAGGTIVITHYTRPRITGNKRAERVWELIWDEYSKRADGPLLDHAFPIINTGFESLEFPSDQWEKVTRMYINARGKLDTFRMNDRIGANKATEAEERVWVEDDNDWSDEQDIAWFKGYLATWVPVIPESDIQELWDELEASLGGAKARTETPIAMVYATKNGN
jgi:trans-aconitate 3-methyltransferase